MGLFIISIAKRLDGALDVRAPSIQCLLAFGEKFMPLIDRCYAGNRARLVVENFVGDMRWNAVPGHAGNYSPPEIMQAPSTNAR